MEEETTNIISRNMEKVGIGIISWNRPSYLKQVIEALEKNDLENTEFHLFQDGAFCRFEGKRLTEDSLIEKSIKIFSESGLPRKTVHQRKENVSIAINQSEAMRFLSSIYRYFIFMENDIVVSPNFMVLARALLKQFEYHKKVACISPGFNVYRKPKEKNIDRLIFMNGHFWTELCWAKKWKEIEKEYLSYYQFVRDQPYRNRNNSVIRDLLGSQYLVTSQDAGKDWAIRKTGMKRARLVVNRATCIGVRGFHATPAGVEKYGEWENEYYFSSEELRIKKFKIK